LDRRKISPKLRRNEGGFAQSGAASILPQSLMLKAHLSQMRRLGALAFRQPSP
jgi:hypothetical protein